MKQKQKTTFSCESCAYQSLKWLGCCPGCNAWNSFLQQEEPVITANISGGKKISMHALDTIIATPKSRIMTGIQEWDRVMGGGIVPGSLIVLTGDPGIGKSTLLLHVCHALAQKQTVYYFSTEESLDQVKQRAQRLGMQNKGLFLSDKTDLTDIFSTIERDKPQVVILDSIQNGSIGSGAHAPGSIGLMKEATFQLMRIAKEHGIAILITSHITKEGIIAGPKTVEHMVDAVFYLHAEDRWQTRLLRAVKNRFGTINELGFFDMTGHGLVEVTNINEQFIAQMTTAPGSALISSIEGSRPLLLEIQSLVITSKLSMPQRVVSGLDHKQVVLISAILEKYLHAKFSTHDIFVKVSNGIKLKGSAADLGIALSLLSSYFQQPLPEKTLILGEISLTGHIKPINQIGILIKEAQKFGIEQIIISKQQSIENGSKSIKYFSHVYELLRLFPDS